MSHIAPVGRLCGVLVAAAIAAAGPAAPLHAQEPTPPESFRPQPSVTLPAELDRVLRDYERHWAAGDADALSRLFVPEGLIVRGGTWIRGRDAIRSAYENASGPLRLRAVEYATDGSVAFIVGAYGYGEARPVEDRGLFVLTLRLGEAGRWLIASDMDRQGG